MVEHSPEERRVGGSSPPLSTTNEVSFGEGESQALGFRAGSKAGAMSRGAKRARRRGGVANTYDFGARRANKIISNL